MSGMDRALQRKRGPSAGVTALAAFAVVVLALGFLVLSKSGETRLRVDPTRLTLAMVETGEFRDYFPFDGVVEAVTTMYLDVEEGGRVEEILVDGGRHVEAGDLILRFSNAAVQRPSLFARMTIPSSVFSISASVPLKSNRCDTSRRA